MKQTSPLDVPMHIGGEPKPTALAQFVHSEHFFLSPKKGQFVYTACFLFTKYSSSAAFPDSVTGFIHFFD